MYSYYLPHQHCRHEATRNFNAMHCSIFAEQLRYS